MTIRQAPEQPGDDGYGMAKAGAHYEFMDAPRRHGLRAGFDRAAEDYQRRPVCPPRLFDDLIDLAGLQMGDPVIEIGCGTGQATVPLAERALAVTAIELGAQLADIALARL